MIQVLRKGPSKFRTSTAAFEAGWLHVPDTHSGTHARLSRMRFFIHPFQLNTNHGVEQHGYPLIGLISVRDPWYIKYRRQIFINDKDIET
jgi:hypothetical protein